MSHRDYDRILTEHIIALREKVARMEADVAHLNHDHDVHVHSGSTVRTDQQLAHIASSLAEAHTLIRMIQADVARHIRKSPPEIIVEWWPALLGAGVLVATILGKSDLASRLAGLR